MMFNRMIYIIILVIGVVPFLSYSQVGEAQDPGAKIDAFVQKWLKEGNIPGMAVGVIKESRVVLLKGYGYTDLEVARPVTPQTIFFIASGAKPFTAMAMGLLVNEGKLEWDKPIRHYLPDFKMSDPFATQHLSLRDLLRHSIALPKDDRVWKRFIGTQGTRRDFMKEISNLEPVFSFRDNFKYQNLGYIMAAYLAETVTGERWEKIVTERIFKPLGMNNTAFVIDQLKGKSDLAFPYVPEKEKGFNKILMPNTGIASPANGIYTNAEDLIKWLQLHLAKGKINGNPFIPEQIIKEMHTIQMAYRQYPPSPNWYTLGYGLGWIIDIYRGHYLLQHGGEVPGFSSMMAFLPFENVGVVVLCNTSNTQVPDYLMRNIMDVLLEVTPLNLAL